MKPIAPGGAPAEGEATNSWDRIKVGLMDHHDQSDDPKSKQMIMDLIARMDAKAKGEEPDSPAVADVYSAGNAKAQPMGY